MDGALNKLREDQERLRRLSNTLRQETITEELEVIVLSVESDITRLNGQAGGGVARTPAAAQSAVDRVTIRCRAGRFSAIRSDENVKKDFALRARRVQSGGN
jgi:hypothetical protein